MSEAIVSINGKVMGELDDLVKQPTAEFKEAMQGVVERGMPPAETPEVAELTTAERAELGRYEAVIKRNLDGFVAAGNALLAIRRDRLYRATYATFDAYCEQRWQLTANFAHKLIGAAEVMTNLQTVDNCTVLPTNEAQARPLTKLEPAEQVEAWQEAVADSGGKPTAAHVERAVERLRPAQPAPTPKPGKATYFSPAKDEGLDQVVGRLISANIQSQAFRSYLMNASVEQLEEALKRLSPESDKERYLKIGNRRELLVLAQDAAQVDELIHAAMPTPLEQAIAEATPAPEPNSQRPSFAESGEPLMPDDLTAAGYTLIDTKPGPGWRWHFGHGKTFASGPSPEHNKGIAISPEAAIADARRHWERSGATLPKVTTAVITAESQTMTLSECLAAFELAKTASRRAVELQPSLRNAALDMQPGLRRLIEETRKAVSA